MSELTKFCAVPRVRLKSVTVTLVVVDPVCSMLWLAGVVTSPTEQAHPVVAAGIVTEPVEVPVPVPTVIWKLAVLLATILSPEVLKCELIVGAVTLAYSTAPNWVLIDAKLVLFPAVVPPRVTVALLVPVLMLVVLLVLAFMPTVPPLSVAPATAFIRPLKYAE